MDRAIEGWSSKGPLLHSKKFVSRQRLSQIEFAAKNHKSLELRVIDTGRHSFRQRMP